MKVYCIRQGFEIQVLAINNKQKYFLLADRKFAENLILVFGCKKRTDTKGNENKFLCKIVEMAVQLFSFKNLSSCQ